MHDFEVVHQYGSLIDIANVIGPTRVKISSHIILIGPAMCKLQRGGKLLGRGILENLIQ